MAYKKEWAIKKKLSAANRLRSTNTKTKLDLTKLIKDFLKPLNYQLQI